MSSKRKRRPFIRHCACMITKCQCTPGPGDPYNACRILHGICTLLSLKTTSPLAVTFATPCGRHEACWGSIANRCELRLKMASADVPGPIAYIQVYLNVGSF